MCYNMIVVKERSRQIRGYGEIGRHKGLKIPRHLRHIGSNPIIPTLTKSKNRVMNKVI